MRLQSTYLMLNIEISGSNLSKTRLLDSLVHFIFTKIMFILYKMV